MSAVRFLRLVSLTVSCLAILPGALFAADAGRPLPLRPVEEIDFREPAVVKALIEESLKAPERKPADEKVFYARGVGHFDDFLPGNPDLSKEQPATSYHRLTFHDGRIARSECVDETGTVVEYQVVRYDRRGAPRATGLFKQDGSAYWYKYAVYDQVGRVSTIYTFNESFELRFSEEFTYRGEAVDIRRADRDGKLQFLTIYEDGGIFLVFDDVKKRVNGGNRKDLIRAPMKHGLKPIYPGYET